MRTSLLRVAVSFVLAGCAHAPTSERCRDEMNACLRGCPQEPYRLEQLRQFDRLADRRSSCEVRCESVGEQCRRSEKAAEERASPDAGR